MEKFLKKYHNQKLFLSSLRSVMLGEISKSMSNKEIEEVYYSYDKSRTETERNFRRANKALCRKYKGAEYGNNSELDRLYYESKGYQPTDWDEMMRTGIDNLD